MEENFDYYYNQIPINPLLERYNDDIITLGLEEKAIYFVTEKLKKAVMEAIQAKTNPKDLMINTDGENLLLVYTGTNTSKILKEIPPLSFKKKVA